MYKAKGTIAKYFSCWATVGKAIVCLLRKMSLFLEQLIICVQSVIRNAEFIYIVVNEGEKALFFRHNYGVGSLLNFEIILLSLGKCLNDCYGVFQIVPCDFLKEVYE